MFERVSKALRGMGNKVKAGAVGAGSAVLLAVGTSGAAMAAGGDIDSTEIVATITGGLAAIAAIGAAFLGFKYLKKVWAKL